MNGMRIIAALFATGCLILGFVLAGHAPEFAGALFIGGTIIFCGILISSAILENKRKR